MNRIRYSSSTPFFVPLSSPAPGINVRKTPTTSGNHITFSSSLCNRVRRLKNLGYVEINITKTRRASNCPVPPDCSEHCHISCE